MTNADQRRDDDIGVRIEGAEWPSRIDNEPPDVLVAAAIIAALAECGPGRPVEIGVLLTDSATVQTLNRRYRDRDAPTNVLAFAAQDAAPEIAAANDIMPADMPVPLGDIIIAGGVCRDEAEAQGKCLSDHVRHLAVHGVLHLLGYDHLEEDEAERMEALERHILAALGVPDPYDSHAAA